MEEIVEALCDEDLYSRLKEFKPDLGPVVDSTRSLYKRLLIKALESNQDATSILNSSKEVSEMESPVGPVTRSKTSSNPEAGHDGETTEEEEDQETEDDTEAMDVADDDFEILDNRELEGEDPYFQRHASATDTAETNNFLIKTVVVGLIFAVLAIIAVAVWIPPAKKV